MGNSSKGDEKMRLSKRAMELLQLIDSRTKPDRFFVPQRDDSVSGAGDAKSLLSLEAKGLIERKHLQQYWFAITDEGKRQLAEGTIQ